MQIAACYIRVSTEEQTEFSPDAQKRALYDYAQKNDMVIDEQYVFVDEGISGRDAKKRPAFMKMIATAKIKPRPFDVILVHRFDRFARSREDSVVYKALLKRQCGIKVISITEQFGDDKFSVIMESMLEGMAEYYSLNLADEVRKGMFEKARRGQRIGKAPFGYRYDKENKILVVEPSEAERVKKLYSMYIAGNSITYITRYFNTDEKLYSDGHRVKNYTVKYILQNPVYCGKLRYNYRLHGHVDNPPEDWIITDGNHEPIISVKEFEKVQDILKKRSNIRFFQPKYTHNRSFLQEVVYCASCGHRMTIKSSNNGKYCGYNCVYPTMGLCDQKHQLSVRKLEKAFMEQLRSDIDNKNIHVEKPQATLSENLDQIKELHEQLKKIERKRQLVKNAYLAEIDSMAEYRKNKLALDAEEKEANKSLADLRIEVKVPKDIYRRFEGYYKQLCDKNLSIADKTAVINSFVSRLLLDVNNNEFRVIYFT
ncbi:MAG: recombinase family protein [Clostridia bacterium]|jgi:DNA invertase Pin-like site-specific DNA recombinase|nr:recombinase family protein [Clostridia bacterium]